MDKNIFNSSQKENPGNKFKNFIKKDGFYLILFICLCVVATVAGIAATTKNKQATAVKTPTVQSKPVVENTSQTKDENKNIEKEKLENANLVKKTADEKASSVATNAKPIDMSFSKPVEGKIIVNYTGAPSTTSKTILGVYIGGCKSGDNVLAALAGKVVYVGTNDEYGEKVIIQHENGYQTEYSNLSALAQDIKVKIDQVVKKGDVIGKVCAEKQPSAVNIYHINELIDNQNAVFFQVFQKTGNQYIDVNPSKYVKYDVVKINNK